MPFLRDILNYEYEFRVYVTLSLLTHTLYRFMYYALYICVLYTVFSKLVSTSTRISDRFDMYRSLFASGALRESQTRQEMRVTLLATVCSARRHDAGRRVPDERDDRAQPDGRVRAPLPAGDPRCDHEPGVCLSSSSYSYAYSYLMYCSSSTVAQSRVNA